MNFALDFLVRTGDAEVRSDALRDSLDSHRDDLKEIGTVTGALAISFNGDEQDHDYDEPLVRLASQWIGKVTWLVAGDTETFALRNSEHCFAFVPTGDSIEVSFFEGDEAEIEEYIIEPTKVKLADFANASIAMGEKLVNIVQALDPELMHSDEDCKDLATYLDEARKAWHDHQLHQRR